MARAASKLLPPPAPVCDSTSSDSRGETMIFDVVW
jgi:hypothetical protein